MPEQSVSGVSNSALELVNMRAYPLVLDPIWRNV
jgi:hypothetical protein